MLSANCEGLRKQHASIELREDRLYLAVKSRTFVLSLRHFDAVAQYKDASILFSFTHRQPRRMGRAGHATSPATGAIQGELNRHITRFLSVQEGHYRQALLARVFGALTDVSEDVDDHTAAEALSARSSLMTVVRLLEQPELQSSASRRGIARSSFAPPPRWASTERPECCRPHTRTRRPIWTRVHHSCAKRPDRGCGHIPPARPCCGDVFTRR